MTIIGGIVASTILGAFGGARHWGISYVEKAGMPHFTDEFERKAMKVAFTGIKIANIAMTAATIASVCIAVANEVQTRRP